MRYLLQSEKAERCNEGLERFLMGGGIVAEACKALETNPGALVMDYLLPATTPGESLEDWLVRQVSEIIVQIVQVDDWSDLGNGCSRRESRSVRSVEFDAEDRAWILERFGRHPEVLQVWHEAVLRINEYKAA